MKLLFAFSILLMTNLSQAGEPVYECHSLKEQNGYDISVYIEKNKKSRNSSYEYKATIDNMDETLVNNELVTNPKTSYLKDKFISQEKGHRGYGKIKWDLEIYQLDRGILLGLLHTYDKELDDKLKDLEIHCIKH